MASHSVTKAKLADGTELEEPEAIEGYLYRLKMKTGARTSVYVSSHDGNLFIMQPANAYPPAIPQAQAIRASSDTDSVQEQPRYTREDEVRRGASQILQSTGYLDLRDIFVVRRPSKHHRSSEHSTPPSAYPRDRDDVVDDSFASLDPSHEEDSDCEEPGGEAHLLAHENSQHLKLKRTFEVVLRTGAVVFFEVCIKYFRNLCTSVTK